ncbi:acyltransferase domain-containing protein [Streptomyces microflavus]|uniref:acyltransferase domain-containing protein n=1 Tax=Streptomyces TaxID=1883 RepID=UPI000BF07DF5|nr:MULTISPECIES: acyltransferase domain-containing protein [unclassified Streptomyces]
MKDLTAMVFPGQGAYRPGALAGLKTESGAAASVLAEISDAANGKLDRLLLDNRGPSLDELVDVEPGLLQLGIFALSVATWVAHKDEVPNDAILMGHSLGEIAALTCAGGYSVQDGTRVVLARNRALEALGDQRGGMVAVGLDANRAAALVCLVDDPSLAVACVNAPSQSVVSGSAMALVQLAELAGRIGVACTRLKAPFAFHGPLMARVADVYRAGIADIPQRPLRHRVYSSLLRRYVAHGDDIGAVLVEQFLAQVNLLPAVQDLFARGTRTFIECGVGQATVGLVRQCVPGVHTSTWDPPAPAPDARPDGRDRPAASVAAVSEHSVARPATEPRTAPAVRPEVQSPLWAPPVAAPADDIVTTLRDMYAEVLGYPREVFEEGADLEADLGVDSLKQTELLARVAERFDLPRSEDMRVADFPTLEQIADEVQRRLPGRAELA